MWLLDVDATVATPLPSGAMAWRSLDGTLLRCYAHTEAAPTTAWTLLQPLQSIAGASNGVPFSHHYVVEADVAPAHEHDFNDWSKTALTIGQNLNSRKYEQLQARGRGFISPDLFQLANTISSNMLPLDYESLVHLESYFVEGKLDMWDQVYLTAGVRNDASSTFGASVRRNWFPKASAAWEASKFMNIQSGNGLLSYLKVRAAYGETGREPTPYQVFSGYSVGVFGDGWTTGLNNSQDGNAGIFLAAAKGQDALKPERNKELEFGTDLAFFDSKVDLGITYYDAKSTDVILSLPVPPSTGYFSQVQNAAEITNKGLEISMNWRAVSSERYSVLPMWIFGATTPGRSESSKLHGHFVLGHSPKPPAPGLYGSSWHAPKRLGSEQSGFRVSRPRSRRKPCASSSVSSARSAVSRQAWARWSWSSESTLVYSLPWRAPRS